MKVVDKTTKQKYEMTRDGLIGRAVLADRDTGTLERMNVATMRLTSIIARLADKLNLTDEEYLELIGSQFKVVDKK